MYNNLYTGILQICRTCMKEIVDTSFFHLDCTPSANTQMTIRQTLYNCIPELDLSMVPNAALCSKCVDNLLSIFEFKKNCLESEIQINKYIQQVQHAGVLNLEEVARFYQPDIKNLGIEIKIEDFEITEDFKNEDSAFNEVSEFTEPKYLLELQKVETQDLLFNTFDDYTINYNLSAVQENCDAHNSREVFEYQNNYGKNLNKTNAYYQCCRCGHKAESKLKLISHLKLHTRKNFYEEIIANRNKSKKSKQHLSHQNTLKSKMRAHIVEKLFSCSICEYRCKLEVNLKQHMRLHTEEKPFSCYVCGYHCSQKSRFKQHILIHTGEKPFSCSICKYQCSLKGNLKKHMLNHTKEKPLSLCSVCGYQCSQSRLKQHILIHTGEKPFSCSVCKYRCKWKCDLKKHVLIHTGEKPFSCSICEYQFSNQSHLRRHMLIHTGDKPFSCSFCEFRCNKKYNLNQHILSHTGEKPFSCSVCEYQCSHKSDLKKHALIHAEEKSFSCFVCEYQCRQKGNLKQHMRTHM